MILYQRKTLPGGNVGQPGPLPADLVGLQEESLANLSWTDPALGYIGHMFVPVEVADPVGAPPVRLSKLNFLRLLTANERVAFNIVTRKVQALTLADYQDVAKAPLVAAEVFLSLFNATDTIDLANPDTAAGVGLLVALGILSQDRGACVLAGTPPV